MMGSTRRRTDRPGAARRRSLIGTGPEALETRQLLNARWGFYHPGFFPPAIVNPTAVRPPAGAQRLATPVGTDPATLALIGNEGRVITGKDRQYNEYVIAIHGPGTLVVTDATPGDGVLDDDIDTILILGSDPHRTYVTGQTTASARVITDGTVVFNRLVAENGVKSIVLNGFNLATTTVPAYPAQPANVGPEIYLPGGVGHLAFNNIVGIFDVAAADQPYEIVIGSPTTPLRQRPSIRLNNVFNTVANSATLGDEVLEGVPQVVPSVSFLVNGEIDRIQMNSAVAAPLAQGGYQALFPTVGTTGRTSIRALGINQLQVQGSARNLVASRAGQPFQPQTAAALIPPVEQQSFPFRSPFSGLAYLNSAQFGGPTDMVGLDVDGRIGHLGFRRGLGDPTGVMPGETNLGFNEAERGAGSFGLYGGMVTARNGIGRIWAGPNNLILQTQQDPNFMQLHRQGQTTYYVRPGSAISFAAITTDASIGDVAVSGNMMNSEIKTGFNYASYAAGLEGTRAPSRIGNFRMRGNLIDSVVSSTYRTVDDVYGEAATLTPAGEVVVINDVAGPGTIRGQLDGSRVFTGGRTALGNLGAGVYARTKIGYLPPPDLPIRAHGRLRT